MKQTLYERKGRRRRYGETLACRLEGGQGTNRCDGKFFTDRFDRRQGAEGRNSKQFTGRLYRKDGATRAYGQGLSVSGSPAGKFLSETIVIVHGSLS